MAKRALHKLSSRAVAGLKGIGRFSDGGGLYLAVSAGNRRRWVFMYSRGGRQREMGLGAVDGAYAVSLAEARRKAAEARELLTADLDPLAEKARRRAEKHDRGPIQTFGAFADAYVATMESAWRNDKHRAQWRYTLTSLCAPLRPLALDAIDTEKVLGVLQPLWTKTPETASRLRGRIEAVLDAAKVKGLRSGENPARWRGHLDRLLPKRQRLTRGHHAALPFADVPAFMEALRQRDSLSARLLEFTILTAARTNEAAGASWNEIDLKAGLWTLPAARMKAGREHRVPLSPRVCAILETMAELRSGPFVFPGRRGSPMANMAMAQSLKRMGYGHVTVHGFRSAFRDWAAETTGFPPDVCEMALAHTVRDKVEAAYRRGDLFEKRRALMAAWNAYCEAKPENVIAIRKLSLQRGWRDD